MNIYKDMPSLTHRLLLITEGEMSRIEMMEHLGLKNRAHFAKNYLEPSLADKLIEMTLPDTPQSRNQKYRLTSKGKKIKRQKNKDVKQLLSPKE